MTIVIEKSWPVVSTVRAAMDGHALTAHRFRPASLDLALLAAREGSEVLMFEYQGVGQSKPSDLEAPTLGGMAEQSASAGVPIVALNAIDDDRAPPSSHDALMAADVSAHVDTIDTAPGPIGGETGDLGYFDAEARPLRRDAAAWYAAISAKPAIGA